MSDLNHRTPPCTDGKRLSADGVAAHWQVALKSPVSVEALLRERDGCTSLGLKRRIVGQQRDSCASAGWQGDGDLAEVRVDVRQPVPGEVGAPLIECSLQACACGHHITALLGSLGTEHVLSVGHRQADGFQLKKLLVDPLYTIPDFP